MKTTKTLSTLKALVIAGAILGSTSVMANGENLFKKCAGCHGVHAEKKALGKSKIINEMSAEEITVALKGYKDGSYGGRMKGLMKGQVSKLDDTQINSLSKYIATLKK